MRTGLIVTVITRGDNLEGHTPVGFRYVDQMFEQAGLSDSLSEDASHQFWSKLRAVQRALRAEFPDRVKWRVLSQWTPVGLWISVRCRVREFPCLIIAGRPHSVDMPLEALVDAVRQALDR